MATIFWHAKNSVFLLTDSGSTSRDISAAITSIDGLPGERAMPEVTALGDAGTKNAAGLDNVKITIEGFYDSTATSGADACLSSLRTYDTATAFAYSPYGTTAGYRKFSGTCKLGSYVVSSPVNEMVKFRAELLVQGAVTIGTN